MEQRKPHEYVVEVFADPTSVKDVVKGILHSIFFHRYFPSIRPKSKEILGLTLPVVDDVELETLIDGRATALIRMLSSSNSPNSSVRGRIAVQLFEKRRRKAGGWNIGFGGLGPKSDEEICWEVWSVDVTLATPKTDTERMKVRKAMEMMLQKAVFKIISIVNRDKDHIPPITETNPFPYKIILNPKSEGWNTHVTLH